MSRRVSVAVCLALGLLLAPGVALADPPWPLPIGPTGVPGVPGDHGKGDECRHRGEPPCHTTTSSTSATTATTGVSGTSATSTTTTTTGVSGTSATSATSTTTAVSGTSTTGTCTTGTSAPGTCVTGTSTTSVGGAIGTAPGGAHPGSRPVASTGHVLANTGATPLWVSLGGLSVLLSGAVLLLVTRRRRA